MTNYTIILPETREIGGHNMAIQLHTADDFRDWLRGKDEDEIVGVRGGSTTNCPIARWLSQEWQQRVYVTCVCGIYDQYGRKVIKQRDLPQWIVDYIKVVDNSEPGDLTAAWALAALDEVTEGRSHP